MGDALFLNVPLQEVVGSCLPGWLVNLPEDVTSEGKRRVWRLTSEGRWGGTGARVMRRSWGKCA